MNEDQIEKVFQAASAANFADMIESVRKKPPSPYFLRAYLNGVLSATAAHLTRELGPRAAYATFQRLADECAADFIDGEGT